MNRLQTLKGSGQSIWLDFIERRLMSSGQLAKMIEDDFISGLTSNPAIFQKAIGSGDEYDEAIASVLHSADVEPSVLFETIAIEDIRQAADIMMPVYERTMAADGYVSLEVSPHLSRDASGTLAAARHLWHAVDRPNLMIKVPGTAEGISAVRQLIAEGINVNVTLLFSRETYRAAAEAYIDGVAALAQTGADRARVSRVASVASFFVSRIDTAVDALIEQRIASTQAARQSVTLQGLLGKIAIANAKLAYQDYLDVFDKSERWQEMVRNYGVRPQRLLWASTGTKNPKYRDVVYVEELAGQNTVNTLPPATLDAFRDHGERCSGLLHDVDAARNAIDILEQHGISLPMVAEQLLVEGLALFADADDRLMATLADKRRRLLQQRMASELYALGALGPGVEGELEKWRQAGNVRRLWHRDSSLWSGGDEACWLDWLDEVDKIGNDAPALNRFASGVIDQGFATAVLIGMGGSSLGPEVLSRVFGGSSLGGLQIKVIDSLDPAQITALDATLDYGKTLFIAASKSGSTLEPDLLCRHFHAQAVAKLDRDAGAHFAAITDPGSRLGELARRLGFRHVFDGEPKIGGRYSIYSNFGMVPAALLGLKVEAVLRQASLMVNSCRPSNPPGQNPGVLLGIALGVAARAGRDKLTLLASPALAPFGAWVEQLVAESTGKHGHGIVPVDAEPEGAPESYGDDRVFVHLRLAGEVVSSQEALVAALEKIGHPVMTFTLSDRQQLMQEFFRWEIATAVAGAKLGIHPFDQPDVEAAKVQARQLIDAYERDRRLPPQKAALQEGPLTFYQAGGVAANQSAVFMMQAFLSQLRPADYVAVLAYLPMLPQHEAAVASIRRRVRDQNKVATTAGFGPRYLHSTGQLHKGGANSGVFLVLTCDDAVDVEIPGSAASFGIVKSAQASGDIAVLLARGRRVLHVHLGIDVTAGLAALTAVIEAALALNV